MKKLKSFLSDNIKAVSWAIIFIFILLFSGSVYYIAKKINFNYELESFFPAGNKNLDYYLDHVKRFETDHDVVLVAITNKNGIFKKQFLEKIKTACDSILGMPEVVDLVSPLQMARMRFSEPKPIRKLFIRPAQEDKYEKDSIGILHTPHFVKNFISFKSSSICFVIKVRPEMEVEPAKLFIDKITAYLNNLKFDKVRLSGRVKSQTYIVSKMQSEFIMLASITAVMLLLFLYFTFRNFWGVILPFLVVTIGMSFTLVAILFISGSLNLISVILPTVLFVVGVSDSVHVLNSYYTELNAGHNKIAAIKLTIKEIGRATFLTAITSAIGFFTLITVNVKPIADFGVFSAIGIMIIYFISFSFLIAMLVVLKPFYLPPQKEIIKHKPFKKLFYFVIKKRIAIGLVFIGLLFPLVYGVFQINVNNYFTEDFRKTDPHKIEFDFFDTHFGGVRPYEISVYVVDKNSKIFDKKVVDEFDKIETFLVDSIPVGGIFSSNTLVKFANQMNCKGEDNAFCISKNDSIHIKNIELMHFLPKETQHKLVSKDLKYGRITGRIRDIGAIEVRKLHAKLNNFCKRNIDSTIIKYKVTGLSEIIDGNIRYLTANMMDGLIYELLAIGILMGLLFRSFKLMLLSLIPNIFPIVFIGGFMGLAGINLNVASSIIFSIAFGITVDDTIHLLARYKLELAKGIDNRTALLNAYMYSGKAVAMTSVILFSGFSILMLSTFTGIFNTGLLVGITLIVALFSDLFLLPILFGHNSKISPQRHEGTKKH